jgi:hypothetical protein
MIKKIFFLVWALVPVGLLAFHYGPGQAAVARDQAAEELRRAQDLEAREEWKPAMEAYASVLTHLPATEIAARRQVQILRAKARMFSGELPEAIGDLEALQSEFIKAGAPVGQQRELRATLAMGQYYAGWLMRLESAPAEEWLAQVDNSRQNFKFLAEGSDAPDAEKYQKNLEAVVRLARMDLSELQALALPKQCQGCKNVSQKCRNQKESQCDKPGEKKPEDARKAGIGKRPDGTGS